MLASYVITSIVQLISLIENNIVLSDEGFEKLLDLQAKLKEHFDRVEKLYYDCLLGHIKEEKKASKILFVDFKKCEQEIKRLDASITSWKPNFLEKRTLPDYQKFLNLKTSNNGTTTEGTRTT
ncbi:hypothetical protein HNV11_16720 [Spirosoma taeanense]|uniref:Uncharacterized protein n=1 Tax=Spirosoma taeanense TaxID=2735870 RepID=A0A6M5YC82_9BACT|nr:hypothetical protein [Spirosoma taeanense]QJW90903.1 hypothetical protein HNV11_16720 [Spirosoma taeanense]